MTTVRVIRVIGTSKVCSAQSFAGIHSASFIVVLKSMTDT